MHPTILEILASAIFATAVIHTFLAKKVHQIGSRYFKGSVMENVLHLLGEVEIVFGLWGAIFLIAYAFMQGIDHSVHYMESQNLTEPAFVFVIMAIAATTPVISFCERALYLLSRLLPFSPNVSFYWTILVVGALLGSLITEPASITLAALILRNRFFAQKCSRMFKYQTIAILFVNISIGGVLTNFAAPPVVMVASTWDWSISHMFMNFGWKAIIAIIINASIASFLLSKQLKRFSSPAATQRNVKVPIWVSCLNLAFLGMVVYMAHHPIVFLGIFLFFMGFAFITEEYQDQIKLKESLLVAFFLGGLVILGGMQSWWLQPLLSSLGQIPLFLGATLLTAFTDNAALTYLGSQVDGLSEAMKYYLVAGAVSGGGLSIIANAPNPAGFAILRESFGAGGINPLKLFLYALLPTTVSVCAFGLL